MSFRTECLNCGFEVEHWIDSAYCAECNLAGLGEDESTRLRRKIQMLSTKLEFATNALKACLDKTTEDIIEVICYEAFDKMDARKPKQEDELIKSKA